MSKTIKRAFSALLMLVMLATTLCITAFATPPEYTYLLAGEAEYTSLTEGSEIRIPVSLANMSSDDYLSGFYCHLDNTEYLTIKGVEFSDEIGKWSGGYNSATQDINKVQLSFASDPSTAKHDNGLLFTVVYTIAKEIPYDTVVNPAISGVMLSKTSQIFLNSADGSKPTEEEKAASIVYPENGSINVPTPANFTVSVTAAPASVVMDDIVTVEVTVTGNTFSAASYSLTYETDKFELVDMDSTAVENGENGFKAFYLDTSFDGSPSGTVIGTYTFKALAQDTDNVVGYFTLGDYAGIGIFETAAAGEDEIAADVSEPAPVTINLIGSDSENGLKVSADDVEKDYDGNAYGVNAVANKEGAVIRYKDTDGEYTLTESPAYSEVGEYIVEFMASLKGYENAYGSATVKINPPKYEVESTEYVAGHSLILVYTDHDGMAFTYDGHTMYDVTAAGYELNGKSYSHVYGIVMKGEADESKLAYAAGTSTAIEYSDDINYSGKVDLQDVVATVGVYNARTEFMNDANMRMVLRADVNHSKNVNSDDIALVFNVVKN